MSGKKIKAKPRRPLASTAQAAIDAAPKLEIVRPELHVPEPTLKLDLACGQTPREGFEGVDLWCEAKHKVNLQKYPWPFETSSVAEIHCSHYVEHIPMEYVDASGNVTNSELGQDALFRFFDEVHRILKPGGWATIIVPNARSNRGFQDPTHRRFFVAETFLYLFADWRKVNKLDHYNVKCNFAGDPNGQGADIVPIILAEHNAWSQEVQNRRFTHEWNTIMDWQARLRAIK